MSFGPLSLEPRLLAAPAAPDEGLTAVPGWRLPGAGRSPVGLRPTSVSLALHALLVLLILIGIPDWLRRHEMTPPPPIEVSLVVPEPPKPPPAPPAPPAPKPPPAAPLASDASSAAPGRPSPAKQEEAAPAAPEPGPAAAPPRKPTPTPPLKVAKPTPAPVVHAATPVPRSAPGPGPAPASTQRAAESETRVATAEPPPEPARSSTAHGEQPPAPRTGKATYTGLDVTPLGKPPGGPEAAFYDAYLAAVRDKIAQQRGLLKPFYLSSGDVGMGLEIDRAGRLINTGLLSTSGSRALDYTVNQMVVLAAPFGPPPPEISGEHVFLRFQLSLPLTQADWDALLGSNAPG